ncbi:MAG TPA: hypothetical protein VF556_14965 [Pyrinomonadaceae bacterium]
MADDMNTSGDRTATPNERSLNEAPAFFSRTTIAVGGVALLFLIIAVLLLSSFLRNPTGAESGVGNSNSATRTNP